MVIGRMNAEQCFEQEINFIGLFLREKIKELLEENNIEECKELLLKHYEMLNKKQKEFTERFFEELDEEETVEFFENLIENGIPIHQGPFTDNINIYQLNDIYNYYIENYGLDKCIFTKKDKDGDDIELVNKMCIGEVYMMRLKHDSTNKNSMRSTNLVDLNNLPAKDRDFKEYKSLYPKTPIKWSEQEVMNSMLPRDTSAIREMLDSYGISEECESILENELLTGNPFDIDIKFPEHTKTKVTKVNDELLYALGLELEED